MAVLFFCRPLQKTVVRARIRIGGVKIWAHVETCVLFVRHPAPDDDAAATGAHLGLVGLPGDCSPAAAEWWQKMRQMSVCI